MKLQDALRDTGIAEADGGKRSVSRLGNSDRYFFALDEGIYLSDCTIDQLVEVAELNHIEDGWEPVARIDIEE